MGSQPIIILKTEDEFIQQNETSSKSKHSKLLLLVYRGTPRRVLQKRNSSMKVTEKSSNKKNDEKYKGHNKLNVRLMYHLIKRVTVLAI